MALNNELDTVAVQARLADWLNRQLVSVEGLRIANVNMSASAGLSMTTILFTAFWTEGGQDEARDLVARVAPATPGVFEDTDLFREFNLLRALEDTGVKVPTARWFEPDPDVLGDQFLIVDRAYGEVPGDDPPYTAAGWVLDVEPACRGVLYDGAIEVMGQVGKVDWRAKGIDEILDKPEFGEAGITQQIARWESFYEWARNGTITSPTIEAALDWFKSNEPGGEDLVLNWGDPRLGNIIYDKNDLSVQAVLDWELAAIASPEMDLGWFVNYHRFSTEGLGIPTPLGMPNRTEIIDRWERVTGRKAAHTDYYEAFAAFKMAAMMVRAGSLMIASGKVPPDSEMAINNPPANMLANLLGLPSPSGQSDFFVGRR